jgi:hypothetical protein
MKNVEADARFRAIGLPTEVAPRERILDRAPKHVAITTPGAFQILNRNHKSDATTSRSDLAPWGQDGLTCVDSRHSLRLETTAPAVRAKQGGHGPVRRLRGGDDLDRQLTPGA